MWILEGAEGGVLTILYRDAGEILPVFSLEEAAEDFRCLLGAFGGGMRKREISTTELSSLLEGGPLSGVRRVILDPPPGMDADEMIVLISLERERFVRLLADEGRSGYGSPP